MKSSLYKQVIHSDQADLFKKFKFDLTFEKQSNSPHKQRKGKKSYYDNLNRGRKCILENKNFKYLQFDFKK